MKSYFIAKGIVALFAFVASVHATPLPNGPINVDMHYVDSPAPSGFFNSNGIPASLLYQDNVILTGTASSVTNTMSALDFGQTLYFSDPSDWTIDYDGTIYAITQWNLSGGPEITIVDMDQNQLIGTPIPPSSVFVPISFTSDGSEPIDWKVDLYKQNGELVESNMSVLQNSDILEIYFSDALLGLTNYYFDIYYQSSNTMTFTALSDADQILIGKLNNFSSYDFILNFSTEAIPEPSSYATILGGLVLLGTTLIRRKRKRLFVRK